MSGRRSRHERQGDPDEGDGLWVQSRVAASGAYVVEFHVGDRAWVRNHAEATAHALGVIRQAEIASHDAAVIRQLVSLGLPLQTAAMVVAHELRPDRPVLDAADLAPIWLEPGVTEEGESVRPFLAISLDGERLGQWTVTDAHQHALAVLQIVTTADMDAAYKRTLVGAVGLEGWRAANVVDDLGSHRWPGP